MIKKTDFYIDGQWVAPAVENEFPVINPANEEVCATISLGGKADVDAAVKAARRAFESFVYSSKKDRLDLLHEILRVYLARSEDLTEVTTLEMGAPVDLSRDSQTTSGDWHIEGFIRVLEEFDFERPFRADAPNDRIIYEGVGVIGMITPWNWPMNQVALKVIPALAAGCSMILKPSELAPLSSVIWAEIMDEAGVPAGVFNMINGDGMGVGSALTAHPGVDAISFTGSTRAGIAISQSAAATLKPVHLELGGKSANIIFADADEKAVKRGVNHCFQNTGQSCNAPTRMLVERSIYDQSVEAAVKAANDYKVDDPAKPGKHMGPVVSQMQYDKIQTMIQAGIEDGARLVAGGLGRPEGFNHGYFVRPTVFADVTNEMRIAREEIFGPVLSIIPFDTEEEAVNIANDTEYGLSNYVQTADGARRNRLARQLRSGMVEMNGQSRANGMPFGGMKQSGNGREGGVWGLEDFLEVKAVSGWSNEDP